MAPANPQAALPDGLTRVDHAKLELLRDACFESLSFVRIFCEAWQLHIQGGDDTGLVHSIRMATAPLRALVDYRTQIETIRAAGRAPMALP